MLHSGSGLCNQTTCIGKGTDQGRQAADISVWSETPELCNVSRVWARDQVLSMLHDQLSASASLPHKTSYIPVK